MREDTGVREDHSLPWWTVGGRVQEDRGGRVHTVLSSGPGSPVRSLRTDSGRHGLCEADAALGPVMAAGSSHRHTACGCFLMASPRRLPSPQARGRSSPGSSRKLLVARNIQGE